MQCPICEKFDKADHFTCPECKRDYICGAHYDVDELVCNECAEKYKGKVKKKEAKKPAAAGEPAEVSTDAKVGTPFYFKKLSCPMCGAITENRLFKPKIYSERKTDIDKHVLAYSWSEPEFNKYHPPLYLFWHCPSCRYTAEKLDFENPTKNSWNNFRELKAIYPEKRQQDRTAEKLISWLSKDVDYNQINYPMAFKLHLLGIYIQEMVEPDERDTLKLGRYYIRAGWLIRELKEKKKELDEQQIKLQEQMKEIERKKDELGDLFEEKKKQHAQKIKEFEINRKEIEEKSNKELSIINNIMTELTKVWKEFPAAEEDIIKKSLEYLNNAYSNHPGIKNPAAAIDMLLWVAGVYIKIGEQDTGLSYLNNVIQAGQKQKIKVENRLKVPDITDEDFRHLSLNSKKSQIPYQKQEI